MKKKKKIRYVSIKLPACGDAYPIDKYGCLKLPDYTDEYLKSRAKVLFDAVFNRTPQMVYSELVKLIKEQERL